MLEKLSTAMGELEQDDVMSLIGQLKDAGTDDAEILAALQVGMQKVGELYEAKEYYLSELIISGDIFQEATGLLGSADGDGADVVGTIVMGTVKDDIHNIGKDIVISLWSCNGFKVIDLGIDVPVENFVAAVKEHKPDIVAMSCLLTSCFENMKATVDALEAEGLRADRKILIGGGTMSESVGKFVTADAFTASAQEGVVLAKKLMADLGK